MNLPDRAVKDLCWCQSTACCAVVSAEPELSKICAGVNPQLIVIGPCLLRSCQRSVLVSIHSMGPRSLCPHPAVKDLCWCQSTAVMVPAITSTGLSKICAGVNPQLTRYCWPTLASCQRSVLVSIHSKVWSHHSMEVAVKDLCWCQSTAARPSCARRSALSKICAGVNPQPAAAHRRAAAGCQRSVLVSIHSVARPDRNGWGAVKDLCWCQSTAVTVRWSRSIPLSKICAGVNPQRAEYLRVHQLAVKDLCWCQSTAKGASSALHLGLSKICAGVNPQPDKTKKMTDERCQRSVLVSIHSRLSLMSSREGAVKDLCWCQSTAA